MASFFAVVLLIVFWPLFLLLSLAIKFSSKGPVFFGQKRIGKSKKPFTIYKFRTMVVSAEKLKKKYLHLNEASGPVFKIKNDPRYTKIGKCLARTGLDELPQLINIAKGEMTFVGPRPLPIDEASKIPKQYQKRFNVLPGITSLWVVRGSHRLSFKQWMELDIQYINTKSFWNDVTIAAQTAILTFRNLLR